MIHVLAMGIGSHVEGMGQDCSQEVQYQQSLLPVGDNTYHLQIRAYVTWLK